MSTYGIVVLYNVMQACVVLVPVCVGIAPVPGLLRCKYFRYIMG